MRTATLISVILLLTACAPAMYSRTEFPGECRNGVEVYAENEGFDDVVIHLDGIVRVGFLSGNTSERYCIKGVSPTSRLVFNIHTMAGRWPDYNVYTSGPVSAMPGTSFRLVVASTPAHSYAIPR